MVTAWAIATKRAMIPWLSTIHHTRARAIQEIIAIAKHTHGDKITWRELHKWGYRCVKVKILLNEDK
jgi:hypothetical protein